MAKTEETSPLTIASLAMQLLANEIDNRETSSLAKSMIYDGNFGKDVAKVVPVDKSLFIIDLLEIGRRKYTQLRQLLLPNGVNFPAFNKLVDFRDNVFLRSHIHTYPNPSKPIGVCTSYILFVKQTVERIMSTLIPPSDQDYLLSFRMADGLDGSGSHAIYNQECTNTTTKNFILFCFKPISIATQSGHIIWNNVNLNSPFTQRPVFLCAAKECEDNIRTFMNVIINCDTDTMKEYGVDLADGKRVKVDILRSMFDCKLSALLSGAGGASCQMCTATRADVKDHEFVVQGFPINRKISDARDMFGEIENVESFFALPSDQRFNITQQPISTIDIYSVSPLHSHTCVFRWFNLLIYHLHCRTYRWSPTAVQIKQSMTFVRTVIQEQTSLQVDQPDP